ncbi:unnamed protein product [Dicrocoelium dendriticum]|nr:unnamed protein product [Dicrocoelium dendriticum]
MGMCMCDILRVFNAERQHAVNVRIGIHTGIAHAAILGFERFRYDVYSYDVRIANELESTGKPGFVHISQATYDEVKEVYIVTPGPDLVVDKREQSFLIDGSVASVSIPTYFIEPQARLLRVRSIYDGYAHPRNRSIYDSTQEQSEPSALEWSSSDSTDITENSDSSFDSTESSGEWFEFELSPEALANLKLSHQTNALHLRRDMELIQDLRTDPAKQQLLFQSPPVDPVLLQFVNSEIEWHYQQYLRSNIGPTYVDSEKLARTVDAIVLFIFTLLLSSVGFFDRFDARHIAAQIESEASEKAIAEANEMLFNIVPAYVFEELKETGKGDLTKNQGTLHYAVAHPLVGVAFISVSNFFSTLYREDLGGAERSLRLLHTIMCAFDKLLHHPSAKDVEKIKSMNENYMVSAGLNRKEVAKNADKMSHLCALMRYCFLLRKVLQEIRIYDRTGVAFLKAKLVTIVARLLPALSEPRSYITTYGVTR